MGRVVLLEQDVVDQIAAGEVVERPASVVKELVENAIDAGATQITVEIKEAGLQEIRVVDNGCGMSEEDAHLAIERYATSKIHGLEDLERIATLGFRGEALPSIAAVSRFTLVTRPVEELSGTRLEVEGGKLLSAGPIGAPPGTQVTVKDLFFNTPPRRKFLKSTRTEAGAVSDLLSRFALGYPDIAFKFYSGKRLYLATSGRGSLLEAARAVYGSEAARNLLEVSWAEEGIIMQGLVSCPGYTRANRSFQSFFVNRRLVFNTFLNHALENAYWGFITRGHYPLAVIHLELDPGCTDVNVHPTKREVRFSNPALVGRVIQQGVRRLLTGQQLEALAIKDQIYAAATPAGFEAERTTGRPGAFLELKAAPNRENCCQQEQQAVVREPLQETWLPIVQEPPANPEQEFRQDRAADADTGTPGWFSTLQVVGQVQGTYILAEKGEEVYFIDQHAAHERIRYEELKRQLSRGRVARQPLGIYLAVDLNPAEWETYVENREMVQTLGYTLEEGREGELFLKEVPSGLRQGQDPVQSFREVLDLLEEAEQYREDHQAYQEQVAALYACKSSVKAGDRLSRQEMEELLSRLDRTSQPGNCPHGRPTYFKMTGRELARRFLRT